MGELSKAGSPPSALFLNFGSAPAESVAFIPEIERRSRSV